MTLLRSLVIVAAALFPLALRGDIFRWDNGQVIPGTEGIEPGPGIRLASFDGPWNSANSNLRFADFEGKELAGAAFNRSWLDNATFKRASLPHVDFGNASLTNVDLIGANLFDGRFFSANLTAANLNDANLADAEFGRAVLEEASFENAIVTNTRFYGSVGFRPEQLYSTASYKEKNLQGVDLGPDLAGWSFARQNLSRASIHGDLTDADFTDAIVRGANISGMTQQQLYSTASYQRQDLRELGFWGEDLSGWDFARQNLTGAWLLNSTLTNADFTQSNIARANLHGADGFTLEQLYSTANYAAKDLSGISFGGVDLKGADFAGFNLTDTALDGDLTNADFTDAIVTGATFSDFLEPDQLYSTASYRQKNLTGIRFAGWLTGWNFVGQNLMGVDFSQAELVDVDLTDANLRGTAWGIYEAGWDFSNRDLTDASFICNHLRDADFSGANLTNARLTCPGWSEPVDYDLTNANFTDAVIVWAWLDEARPEQIYSTESYKSKDLRGIRFSPKEATAWDFASQNLIGARFRAINRFGNSVSIAGTDFSGADLRNASIQAESNGSLDGVLFDSETIYNQWSKFPPDFDPAASGLKFVESPSGDFNANDVLDAEDIDFLMERLQFERWLIAVGYTSGPIVGGPRGFSLPGDMFDVNHDTKIDHVDIETWVHGLTQTWFGDSNLDGEFNSADLVTVFTAGEYEDSLEDNSGWAEGDWNGDGDFSSSDIVLAFTDGGYEQGPRPGVNAVPEPSGIGMLTIAVAIVVLSSTRRRSDS